MGQGVNTRLRKSWRKPWACAEPRSRYRHRHHQSGQHLGHRRIDRLRPHGKAAADAALQIRERLTAHLAQVHRVPATCIAFEDDKVRIIGLEPGAETASLRFEDVVMSAYPHGCNCGLTASMPPLA